MAPARGVALAAVLLLLAGQAAGQTECTDNGPTYYGLACQACTDADGCTLLDCTQLDALVRSALSGGAVAAAPPRTLGFTAPNLARWRPFFLL